MGFRQPRGCRQLHYLHYNFDLHYNFARPEQTLSKGSDCWSLS
jgi:hypothetical protein